MNRPAETPEQKTLRLMKRGLLAVQVIAWLTLLAALADLALS